MRGDEGRDIVCVGFCFSGQRNAQTNPNTHTHRGKTKKGKLRGELKKERGDPEDLPQNTKREEQGRNTGSSEPI